MIDIYIGVDPSINSSGVTCLAYEDNKLVKEMYYIIKQYNKTLIFKQILNDIQECIKKFIAQVSPNGFHKLYVCQEGISYGSSIRTKSVFDLAGLNFLLRMMIIDKLNADYFIIATPAEIKKKTTGNGNCNKDAMIGLFKSLKPNFNLPKLDDIADSFWMASYIKNLHDENKL